MKVHYSSKTPEWATPQELFDRLNDKYKFTLDPCATAENAKCDRFFTEYINGLNVSWSGDRVFMNPPYGRQITHWVKKAYEESLKGTLVVCLLPSRTDTKWFHEYCMKGEIEFLKGRLYFNDGKGRAPFPSMIVVFKQSTNRHGESV